MHYRIIVASLSKDFILAGVAKARQNVVLLTKNIPAETTFGRTLVCFFVCLLKWEFRKSQLIANQVPLSRDVAMQPFDV